MMVKLITYHILNGIGKPPVHVVPNEVLVTIIVISDQEM